MTPLVWLFRRDSATIRIIQRDAEPGSEVVVLGSEGLRSRQVFQTRTDADAFRAVLTTEFLGSGFVLAWTNVPASTPAAEESEQF
jgi:hypothetical protein